MSPPPQRVIVVGSSCAGKSTFARALSEAAALPCVELDHLFWGPHWTAKPTAEFRALVDAAAAADSWIIEGNYGGVRDVLWPRAELVVWLNYDFPLIFWRALRRTVARNLCGQELWHGNRESIKRSFLSRDSILVWVATTFRKRRRQFHELRAGWAFPHLRWLEFRHPAQAQIFLRQVRRGG